MADTKEITRPAPRTPAARRVVEVPGRGRPKTDDSRRLTVGREICLAGEISSCDTLIVEGEVRAALTGCRSLEIAKQGIFNGAAEVDIADIAGVFDGDLTVRQRLVIHGTGRATGTIRYGELEIERGGLIVGTTDVLGDVKPGEARPEAENKAVSEENEES